MLTGRRPSDRPATAASTGRRELDHTGLPVLAGADDRRRHRRGAAQHRRRAGARPAEVVLPQFDRATAVLCYNRGGGPGPRARRPARTARRGAGRRRRRGSGRVVFVGGEAGIGKTALVEHFADRVDADVRVRVRTLRCARHAACARPVRRRRPGTRRVDAGSGPRRVARRSRRRHPLERTGAARRRGRPLGGRCDDRPRRHARPARRRPARCCSSSRTARTRSVLGTRCARRSATWRRRAVRRGSASSRSRSTRFAQLAEPLGASADEVYALTGGNPFYVTEALAAPPDRCRRACASPSSPGRHGFRPGARRARRRRHRSWSGRGVAARRPRSSGGRGRRRVPRRGRAARRSRRPRVPPRVGPPGDRARDSGRARRRASPPRRGDVGGMGRASIRHASPTTLNGAATRPRWPERRRRPAVWPWRGAPTGKRSTTANVAWPLPTT